MNQIKYEYHFNDNDHFIETPFVKSDSDVIRTSIDTPELQGAFFKYPKGIEVLVISNITEGKVAYYTNCPLKEIAHNRFIFDVS
ncbi:hypothetical protein IGI39_004040 [Enterococcus sp. AZ135]|uniref:hypothetical protein n=1 Tax=unclassified Enterococcus TaxID=2608891 RepID=UPI003F27DAEC